MKAYPASNNQFGFCPMALSYVIFGFFVAIASGAVAAAMGASGLEIVLTYAGCGGAVLFAAFFSAMIYERDDRLHEDPMLIPGK